MLDFALIIGKQPPVNARSNDLLSKLRSMRSVVTNREYFFQGENLTAWVWHTSIKPFIDGAAAVRTEPNLKLYQGYAMKDSCKPVDSVDELNILDASRYGGDFLLLDVDKQGFGKIVRSRVSNQQVYYAQCDRISVISSRATIAAALFWMSSCPPINSEFIRWICSYGVCSNCESLFRHVQFLRMDQSIDIKPTGLAIESQGPASLFCQEMKSLYVRNRDAFWDLAFEQLLRGMNCLDFVDDEIDFPLSGGKDSRLLLGLLVAGGRKDRIDHVYTNGPSVSPDVRAAREICEALGFRHEYVDGTNVVRSKDIVLSDKLLTHLSISEAETSPMDLFWQRRIHGKIALHGQEGGLRNIAGKNTFATREQLLAWFRRHLGNGDMCKIYNPGVAERNLAEIESFVDEAAEAGLDWSDIPALHRVTFRLARWVSRTWKAYNELGFAPYILVNSDVISMTLSAGHRSRILEEFHFEMFRRIDPRLITIPFAGQQWEAEMIERCNLNVCNPAPYQWPSNIAPVSRRATHEAFYHNIDDIVSYICNRAGSAVLEIIDLQKLASFDKERLQPGHYQPLWQALQCVLTEAIPDWTLLNDPSFAKDIELPPVDLLARSEEAIAN